MSFSVPTTLLVAAFCSLVTNTPSVSAAESMVQITLEYEKPNCQGSPITKHMTLPGRQGSGGCKETSDRKTSAGASGSCKKTPDGTSSYTTSCEPSSGNWQAPAPGYLCRMMYERSPDCSDASAVKQVDCFTLNNLGKCWSRSGSSFSVASDPQGAGASARTMKLAFDAGSVTSGQQYAGPANVKAPQGSGQIVEAFSAGNGGSACNTGGCTCSSKTVVNGECDGHGTKYVW